MKTKKVRKGARHLFIKEKVEEKVPGTFSSGTFSSYKGLQRNIRRLKTPQIEVWENQYPDKDYLIDIDIPEFTCICPKTGLPDFATIHIRYRPKKWCLELKSLKLYVNWYRNVGIFNEHVVNKILEDLVKACKPRSMEVVGEFNPRGGIKTTVKAEYGKTKINT